MGARPRPEPAPRHSGRALLVQMLVLAAAVLSAYVVASATSQVAPGGNLLGVGAALIDRPASTSTQPVRFAVRPGQSGAEIADNLQQAGLIDSAVRFQLVGRLHGGMSELRAGEYSLRPSMRPSEIIEVMRGGVGTGWVTIPEGWRTADIADYLNSRGISKRDAFVAAARSGGDLDVVRDRPADSSLEGYLFPDTYQILPRATADQIVAQMLRAFTENVTPEMRAQAAKSGLTFHQVMTLASIVEREAVVADERPLIAGVYLNRMQKGLKLQADPTVQYALAGIDPPYRAQGYWKAPLTSGDVTINSPYNTYVVNGLPPGPIANPGLAAIKAVLTASPTEYLYFVAKPDGRHAFARTYKEHEDNVSKYLQP